MTDLDQILAAHVRAAAASASPPPPLQALRRRATRRRAVGAGAVLAAAAAAVSVLAVSGVLPGASGDDRVRVADGGGSDLEPYRPAASVGALAGRVAEVPEGEQRPVTLRFTGTSGQTRDVRTRQGGTWKLELAPGRWTITALEGGGVCSAAVTVTAGAWQRHDIAWPCSDSPAGPTRSDERPPTAMIAATVDLAVGERLVPVELDLTCGVGPLNVNGETLFFPSTYSAPGTNPPGWTDPQPGLASRIDKNTVIFRAANSTIRIMFHSTSNTSWQPADCS
jgi:hypothetical protein